AFAPTGTAITTAHSPPTTIRASPPGAGAAAAGAATAAPASSLQGQNGDKVSFGILDGTTPNNSTGWSDSQRTPRCILEVAPDASPLLRHLGKCLSPEQTTIEARWIWIEALAQPSCDGELVEVLPHPDWAIPTAADGLCELRSREVYERVTAISDHILWAVVGSAAAEDNLRNASWVTRHIEDDQDALRLIFTRACGYASSAILWYCVNRLNINNDVLWEGLAEACSCWNTATAKKVWRHISERDLIHSAQPVRVVSSLKTSFARSIENNKLDLVAFFCDSGIAKPSVYDVILAVQHRRLDILRYFCDDPTCPKTMTAKDLRTSIRFWVDDEDTFQKSAPVFDFVMERFSIVGREPQGVYKNVDPTQVLLQATHNMTDQRLKNYIQEFRYRRDVLEK
ncbi:hypothetical protein HK405_012008, partial [Cladochytrium tenue]